MLVARGSGLRYALKPTDGLRQLVAAGKTRLTLSGKVKDAGKPPTLVLTVASARETED